MTKAPKPRPSASPAAKRKRHHPRKAHPLHTSQRSAPNRAAVQIEEASQQHPNCTLRSRATKPSQSAMIIAELQDILITLPTSHSNKTWNNNGVGASKTAALTRAVDYIHALEREVKGMKREKERLTYEWMR
jgi:hypothetical protein